MRRSAALWILLAVTCACGRQPLAPVTPADSAEQAAGEQIGPHQAPPATTDVQTASPPAALPAEPEVVKNAEQTSAEAQPEAGHTVAAAAAAAPALAPPGARLIRAADRARVWRVGSRLRTAGAPLCKDTEHVFGFLVVDRPDFDSSWLESENKTGEPSVQLRVWEVRDDLMSASNLLARGDGILAVDGERMTSLDDFNDAMASARRKGVAILSVKRLDGDGSVSEVLLAGEPACDQDIHLVHDNVIATYPTGGDIYLTTALLETLESDDELALMISHDIAHETLGHLTRKRVQMGVGLLAEAAIMVFTAIPPTGSLARFGKHAFAGGMERDADRHGMYIAARAGYDPGPSAGLWTRFADRVRHPRSADETLGHRYRINTDALLMNHPLSQERVDAMESVSGNIVRQRAAGLALVPDTKRSGDGHGDSDTDPEEPELEPGVVHVVPVETALPGETEHEDLLRPAGRSTMAEMAEMAEMTGMAQTAGTAGISGP